MNTQLFEEWFRHLLEILPRNSIVVLNQAPYHTMLDSHFKNPTSAFKKKEEIVEWLLRREIEIPSNLNLVRRIKRNYYYCLHVIFIIQKYIFIG